MLSTNRRWMSRNATTIAAMASTDPAMIRPPGPRPPVPWGNLVARNLRRGRSGMIGLAVPELSVPYFSELAGLVIAEAGRHSHSCSGG